MAAGRDEPPDREFRRAEAQARSGARGPGVPLAERAPADAGAVAEQGRRLSGELSRPRRGDERRIPRQQPGLLPEAAFVGQRSVRSDRAAGQCRTAHRSRMRACHRHRPARARYRARTLSRLHLRLFLPDRRGDPRARRSASRARPSTRSARSGRGSSPRTRSATPRRSFRARCGSTAKSSRTRTRAISCSTSPA